MTITTEPRRMRFPSIATVLAVGITSVAIFATGVIVRPSSSSAAGGGQGQSSATARDSVNPAGSTPRIASAAPEFTPAGATFLGSLESPEGRIDIIPTDDGLRYRLFDASGVELGDRLTQTEARELIPGFDFSAFDAGSEAMHSGIIRSIITADTQTVGG